MTFLLPAKCMHSPPLPSLTLYRFAPALSSLCGCACARSIAPLCTPCGFAQLVSLLGDLQLPDAGTLPMSDASAAGSAAPAAVLSSPPLVGLYYLAASSEALSLEGVAGRPLWIDVTAGAATKLAPRCSSGTRAAVEDATMDACPRAASPLVVSPLRAAVALSVFVSVTDDAGNLMSAASMRALGGEQCPRV
jgi:hypothetical protein